MIMNTDLTLKRNGYLSKEPRLAGTVTMKTTVAGKLSCVDLY